MEKSIHSAQYEIFLDALRAMRKHAGLNQNELARRIGETQSFVSKCERGERRIDIMELRTFCKAFQISLSDFVDALERSLLAGRKRKR